MRSWGPAAQVSAFPAPEPSRLAGHEQLGVPLPGETATSTPVEPSASALGAEDRSIGRSRSLRAPRYLPPMFKDLNGLAMWMAYSTFFARLGTAEIAGYYGKLFDRTG